MKTFISALLLATMPLCASAQYSADVTLRARQAELTDNQQFVREYDKTKGDTAQADIELGAASKVAVAEVAVSNVNSDGNEDAYFKVNVGPGFALTGSFGSMYHRQPFQDYRVLMNGVYVSPLNTYTWNGVVLNSSMTASWVGMAQTTATLSNLTNGEKTGFERKESFLKALFYGKEGGDHAFTSFWQEDERGNTAARYAGTSNSPVSSGAKDDQVYPADRDNATREVAFGLGTGLGEQGAVAADFTRRDFVENSNELVVRVNSTWKPVQVARPAYSPNTTDTGDFRFRGLYRGVAFNGSFVGRNRENKFNGFTAQSYTGSLAGAYKLNKKTSLTMRLFSRAYGVRENSAYLNDFYYTTSGGTPSTTYTDHIDRYNVSGELKGRYEYSDKLAFRAGYKYENNYRRNAEDYEYGFEGNARYEDGTYVSSHTQHSGTPVHEEKHTLSAAVEAMLPWDISFDAGYTGMLASEAVFEAMPTNSHAVDSGFSVPLPYNLSLNANLGYASEQNLKSSMSDAKMEQGSYQGGLEWQANSAFSVGADYSYDRTSYRNTGWFGEQNNVTGSVQVRDLMRQANMLYRFENQVYGAHATAKLPFGFRLTGGGSYTMTKGKTPVMLDNFASLNTSSQNTNITSGVSVTDMNPSDIRMASARVALSYDYADWLGASIGYRQNEWHDKIVTANSGKYSYTDLSVSAKF